MPAKTSSKPQALLTKPKGAAKRAPKGTAAKVQAGLRLGSHTGSLGIGIPKALTGKDATKAVREAGVVTAAGNLKARFR
jgi:hypothetical protein